jgi:fructoselysine-6-P-deglycase FrlB-like protein
MNCQSAHKENSGVSSGELRREVYGIDFSGATDAGKRIWIARGTVECGVLRILECSRAESIEGFGRDRDQCLAALRVLIARRPHAVFGLDFPFGLPRKLVPEKSWQQFVLSFPKQYRSPDAFRQHCLDAAGGKELRRVTDREASAPFSAYNLRLYRQTYFGIRDLLSPLVRDGLATVLPMQDAQPRGPWILEICPASTLKNRKLYQPYKGRTTERRDGRRSILRALEEAGTLSVPDGLRPVVEEDIGGDALDSVIAALETFEAVWMGREKLALPDEKSGVEGYICVSGCEGTRRRAMQAPAKRKTHPFHMYEAIQAQPALVAEVLEANDSRLEAAAEVLGRQQRLYLCGIGTSFHAALVGEYLLRLIADDRPPSRAVHSFEFVGYPPPIPEETGVIVVSHRGTKNFSLKALNRANDRGVSTVVITGKGSGEGIHKATVVLTTIEQEISAAHTKSYTTALSLLAALAVRLGRRRGKDVALAEEQLAGMPELMRRALQTEGQVREIAQGLAGKELIAFIGGGPNAATAYEVALKMKETNYTPCEGFQVEQFLHGPLAGLSEKMAVWVTAPTGPSSERCLDIVRAANAIGATTVALMQDDDPALASIATHAIRLPAMLEALSPLVAVIPLQLFCYHLALAKGTNPDTFHLDDPRHRQARHHYRL